MIYKKSKVNKQRKFTENELVTLKTKKGEETSIYYPTRDEDNQSKVDPLKYYSNCDFERLIAEAEAKIK